jgi:arginyl-tRNA synthetase
MESSEEETARDIADKLGQEEDTIKVLFTKLQSLSGNSSIKGPVDDPDLINELISTNNKLKYRLIHLRKCLSQEGEKRMKRMTDVRGVINAMFQTAITSSYPSLSVSHLVVQHSDAERFGDYKCTAAMGLSQVLKKAGTNIPPREIAQNIVKNVPKAPPIIENCEVAGPGFVNVFLKPSFISELISDQLVNGIRPPPVDKKLRVVIDFSSPNVAKEMHVGHLRSTIIGETLSRLLEFVGHDVLRLNHLGDWGTQFGMLIAHLKDKFPNYATESPPIGDLQEFYKESKKRFDNDKDFKQRAYANVVLLQNGDAQVTKVWKLICDVSRQG